MDKKNYYQEITAKIEAKKERIKELTSNLNKLEQEKNKYLTYDIDLIKDTLLKLFTRLEKEQYICEKEFMSDNLILKANKDKTLSYKISNQNKKNFFQKKNTIIFTEEEITKSLFITKDLEESIKNIINSFFINLYNYRVENKIAVITEEQLADFYKQFINTFQEDIKLYQKEKEELVEKEKQEREKQEFCKNCKIDKLVVLEIVQKLINENYDEDVKLINSFDESYYNDNNHNYCDFYRIIKLVDKENNSLFENRELSYTASKDLDDTYSRFFYNKEKIKDRYINFFKLQKDLKNIIKKYPKVNEYFLLLSKEFIVPKTLEEERIIEIYSPFLEVTTTKENCSFEKLTPKNNFIGGYSHFSIYEESIKTISYDDRDEIPFDMAGYIDQKGNFYYGLTSKELDENNYDSLRQMITFSQFSECILEKLYKNTDQYKKYQESINTTSSPSVFHCYGNNEIEKILIEEFGLLKVYNYLDCTEHPYHYKDGTKLPKNPTLPQLYTTRTWLNINKSKYFNNSKKKEEIEKEIAFQKSKRKNN